MIRGLPQLGADFTINVTDFPLTNGTFTQVARQDGSRYAIIFSNNTGVAAFIQPNGANAALVGLPVLQGQLPLILYWEQTGGLAQVPWFATCNPANTTLEVIEVFYRPVLLPQSEEQP